MKNLSVEVQKIITRIQSLVNEGNLKRIIIKDHNSELFMEVPLLIGVIGTIAAPYVTAIGVIAGYAAKFTVEITKKDNPEVVEVFEVKTPEE